MPCLISKDVHERINELFTVSTRGLLNLQFGELAEIENWKEKTLGALLQPDSGILV